MSSDAKDELHIFATYFHQDFRTLGVTPREYAFEVTRQLDNKQKLALSNQIKDLLAAHPGKEQKGLRNAWFKLGAEWKPSNLSLFLQEVVDVCGT